GVGRRVGHGRIDEGALALRALVAAAAVKAADGTDAAPGKAERKIAPALKHLALREIAVRLRDLKPPAQGSVNDAHVLLEELPGAVGERVTAEVAQGDGLDPLQVAPDG